MTVSHAHTVLLAGLRMEVTMGHTVTLIESGSTPPWQVLKGRHWRSVSVQAGTAYTRAPPPGVADMCTAEPRPQDGEVFRAASVAEPCAGWGFD